MMLNCLVLTTWDEAFDQEVWDDFDLHFNDVVSTHFPNPIRMNAMCSPSKDLVRRHAITTAETIGILVALTLGIAVGFAILQSSALTATSVNHQTGSESSSPVKNEPATSSATRSTEKLENAVAHEIGQLKQELLSELKEQVGAPSGAEPRATTFDGEYTVTGHALSEAEQVEMGQRTLGYWNQLNDVMLREEQMRQIPMGGLTAANARDFLQRRGQAGQFAAESIRKLSTAGVDPDVIALAADIATWYQRGNQLNDMGSFLLNKADASSRRGEPGQQWQDGEKQHIASVEELNRRGDELRRQLIQKYGLPFPDLR